ncbi:hypothetical protein [Algoriphagus hitonicola]|uniref:Uncharacterized protein n=1 Tax=Algoriphagus hitonicola TaxID=435880 RepID=A0A1I2NQ55_9BACT|nr:hypothetical protein [Algoriphagus hitonicola]SFG06125.1 hypothetical protein SAMN04487988_101258 [Algoriphagus hitonicola]
MKKRNLFLGIFAAICGVILLCLSSEFTAVSGSGKSLPVETKNQLSADFLYANSHAIQVGVAVDYFSNSREISKFFEYTLWISQKQRSFFRVFIPSLSSDLIDFLIHFHRKALIFPFHYFW